MSELEAILDEANNLKGDFAAKLDLAEEASSTLGNTSACNDDNCTPSNVDACKL